MEDREQFLSEFLRQEGRDSTMVGCANCTQGPASYRCQDCESLELLCRECLVDSHKRNGLHRIEVCCISDPVPYDTERVLLVCLGVGRPEGLFCEGRSQISRPFLSARAPDRGGMPMSRSVLRW